MKRRKNSWFALIYGALPIVIMLLGATLSAEATALRLENERVPNFHSNITVRKNGSLLVQERIEVNVLGISIQNGITREFAGHDQQPPKLTVREVKMDDQPIPYRVENSNSVRRIVIGDEDQPLLTGVHIYTLVYETDPQVTTANGRDHLTWNVTGWNWNLPIDSVTATIQLPKGLPAEDLKVEGSTGGEGPRSKRYSFDFDTPGAVTFTAEALTVNEGLTAELDWPLGYVRHRSWGIPLVMMENSGIFVTLIGLAVLLLYWGVLWFYYGRAPKLARIIPRTTPPTAVSAAGLRYLQHRATDSKMFTVMLVSLARTGIMTVEEEEGNYTLRRTTADFHALAPEEREFARVLFGTHESVSLKASPLAVKNAMRALKKALVKSYEKGFTPVRAFAWPALLASGLAIIASMFLELRPNVKEEFVPAFLLLLVFAVCVTLLRHIWPSSLKEWKKDPSGPQIPGAIEPNRPQMFTAILLAVMLLGVTILLATKVGFLWALLLAAQTSVNVWFMKLMRVPTPRGHRLLDDLEGFRFHLRKLAAESAFSAEYQDERQQVFEDNMHYALAFDLGSEWARRIERPANDPQYCPAWYSGEHFRDFYLRKSPSPASTVPGLEGLDTIAGGRFVR